MSKFNTFNPEKANLVIVHGDYSMYFRPNLGKYLLVKNGKVLNYITNLGGETETLEVAMKSWIRSFEYNAKRDLMILRADIAKAEAHIACILSVFEE